MKIGQSKINLTTVNNTRGGGYYLDNLTQNFFVLKVCRASIILNN